MNPSSFFAALFLCILVTPAHSSDGNWSVGLGVITSDVYPDSDEAELPFPTIETSNKRAMFIPDLAYHWDQWSIGATGLRWKTKENSDIKSSFTLGFPSSSFRIGGERGWFRYGVLSNAQFTDGILWKNSIYAGPLGYENSRGLASRSAERADSISFGAPVFINKELALTVIGKLSYTISNADYKTRKFKLNTALPEDDYTDISANLFAIKKLGESVTWINSGTWSFADDKQQALINGLKSTHFNLFSLIQYSF